MEKSGLNGKEFQLRNDSEYHLLSKYLGQEIKIQQKKNRLKEVSGDNVSISKENKTKNCKRFSLRNKGKTLEKG